MKVMLFHQREDWCTTGMVTGGPDVAPCNLLKRIFYPFNCASVQVQALCRLKLCTGELRTVQEQQRRR